MQLEVRWVNSRSVPHYLDQDFTQITPNQYLSQNCPLSAIEHTVEAIVADAHVKQALHLRLMNLACYSIAVLGVVTSW